MHLQWLLMKYHKSTVSWNKLKYSVCDPDILIKTPLKGVNYFVILWNYWKVTVETHSWRNDKNIEFLVMILAKMCDCNTFL